MYSKKLIGTVGTSVLASAFLLEKNFNKNKMEKNPDKPKIENTFTYDEVSKHNINNNIWVTYKENVYDISKFINNHPGGKDKIMLAAGKGLEPYWNTYKQHTNNPSIIKDILEPMKIGTLKDYNPDKYKDINDPYINDPNRDTDLKFHSVSPCNAETPKDSIMDNWITPNELWYIRNHHPVPIINPKDFKLNISTKDSTLNLSLDDLKKLKSKKVITTIQCGGNRRGGLNDIEKTSGTPWSFGAISTAEWEGISLRDILLTSGVTDKKVLDGKVKHIQFEGEEGVKSSIPAEKAMNIYGDVILAYKMNGEEIPRDHGYPLRLIVPGHVGIRNIKWVKNIKTSTEEAEGTWQRGISYKGLPHYIKDVKKVNIDKVAAIQELPVQSCIVSVEKDENDVIVKGFAWSGGGRGIIRVDVSVDSGVNWQMADLKEGSEQPLNKAWAWTFWQTKFKKDDINSKMELYCKATDSSYNVQPEKLEYAWNIRGLNNNSWHKLFEL